MSGVRSGLAVVLLVALAAGGGCRGDEENPAATTPASRTPNEGIRGVQLSSYRVGDTRWILQADTASVFRDRKRVEAERVKVDFYDADEHVSVLTAATGILLQATDDLEARGDVRVLADDGATLETEVLFWDHERARIYTDAFVRLTRGTNVLTGIGLEADPGLDRVEIRSEVAGEMRDVPEELAEDGPPTPAASP